MPLIAGALLEDAALAVGFLAAAIAVGGFAARAVVVLSGYDKDRQQLLTVLGGVYAGALAVWIIILDQLVT